MKKITKSLLLIMTVVLLCFAVSMCASAETYSGECGAEGDNVVWSYDTDTCELVISGTGAMPRDYFDKENNFNDWPWWNYRDSIKKIVIEDGVTTIGSCAFLRCTNLTEVTIPNSVTYLWGSAFQQCTSLVEITIPDSVEYIEIAGFMGCTNLKKVTLSNNLNGIGWAVFSDCINLTEIKLPKGVSMSNRLFSNCISLTKLTIPDGEIYIEEAAFKGCSKLAEIVIPDSVTNIDEYAFDGCNNLKHIGYEGTEEQWKSININWNNSSLLDAPYKHFKFNTESDIAEKSDLPTCQKEGINGIVCSCGYIYSGEILPKVGCSFSIFVDDKNATCLADGTETAYCDYGCENKHTVKNENSALGHNIVSHKAKSPDCNNVGWDIYENCTRCGYSTFKGLPSLGHDMSEWFVAENGKSKYQCCSRCDYKITEIITDDGNIEIENPNNPDDNFEVDEIIPTDYDYVIIDKTVGDNGTVVKAFDITMTNKDGVHVQPNGTVKVKLPLDWSKQGIYKVYRINDDGTLTDMNAYRQGSHVVFDTDHFSLYVIVDESVKGNQGNQEKPDNNCSCNCHKSGFMGFIWKILNFFYKLFKTNKTCICGINHY